MLMHQVPAAQADRRSDAPWPAYVYADLPTENVYGHRRKVELLREAIDALRTREYPNLSILDAGCGSGYAVTRFLARRGDRVTGIDMYAPAIAYAQSRFGGRELGFECVDLAQMQERSGTYDVVVLADVLEHLHEPRSVLVEAARMVTPRGRLLLSIPNGFGPFEIESAVARMPLVGPALVKLTDLAVATLDHTVARGRWSRAASVEPSDLPYNEESGHVRFFTPTAIDHTLADAGWGIEEWRHLSWLAGPFTSYWWAPSVAFCEWNARIAERLPRSLVSSWFMVCSRREASSS